MIAAIHFDHNGCSNSLLSLKDSDFYIYVGGKMENNDHDVWCIVTAVCSENILIDSNRNFIAPKKSCPCIWKRNPCVFLGCPWQSGWTDGQRREGGPGLQGRAHEWGAEASVQPGSSHHHVPHPRVQMVTDAPALTHWSALCSRGRPACVEEVSFYYCTLLYYLICNMITAVEYQWSR